MYTDSVCYKLQQAYRKSRKLPLLSEVPKLICLYAIILHYITYNHYYCNYFFRVNYLHYPNKTSLRRSRAAASVSEGAIAAANAAASGGEGDAGGGGVAAAAGLRRFGRRGHSVQRDVQLNGTPR
jgi:hypothetical protein